MATFSSVTRQHLLQAIAEHDTRGAEQFLEVYGFVPSPGYALVHEGRSYDVAAILGVAHRFATGRLAPPDEFNSDRQGAVAILRKRGFEVSEPAIAGARAAGVPGTSFVVDDATAWAGRQTARPDLVVVNPPRRGLGERLDAWLEASGVPSIVYSSCNAVTLARDLAALPSYRPVAARVFDMFPQTSHSETMALLTRRG